MLIVRGYHIRGKRRRNRFRHRKCGLKHINEIEAPKSLQPEVLTGRLMQCLAAGSQWLQTQTFQHSAILLRSNMSLVSGFLAVRGMAWEWRAREHASISLRKRLFARVATRCEYWDLRAMLGTMDHQLPYII